MFKRPKLYREDNEGKHLRPPLTTDKGVTLQFLLQNFELGPLTRSLIREIVAFIFSPPKATTLGGEASAIPKGSQPPMNTEKLDYASDKQDALLTLSPDGKLDSPPTWSGVNNADQSEVPIEMHPNGKNLQGIVRLPTDVDSFDFTVKAKAPVDDPATPDIEEVTAEFHIAGSHSKATDLTPAADSVAKGAGFP